MNDSCYKSPSLFPYPFSGIGSYTVRQILSVQLLALFFIRYSLYRFEIQTKAGFFLFGHLTQEILTHPQ